MLQKTPRIIHGFFDMLTIEVRNVKVFLLGAVGYPLLELCWRGRTHISMVLAGGLSASLLHHVSHNPRPLWQKALLGGCGITAIEAACGLAWNRHHQVWDYRHLPLNWRGQICLPYTLMWCGLSALWLLGEEQFTFSCANKGQHPAEPHPQLPAPTGTLSQLPGGKG